MKDSGRSAMHKLLLAMALGLAVALPSGHALAGKDPPAGVCESECGCLADSGGGSGHEDAARRGGHPARNVRSRSRAERPPSRASVISVSASSSMAKG